MIYFYFVSDIVEKELILSLGQTESTLVSSEPAESKMPQFFTKLADEDDDDANVLYEQLKKKAPEFLNVLAPDAGDEIIPLDFSSSGEWILFGICIIPVS